MSKMAGRVLTEQNSRTALTLYEQDTEGKKLPQYTAAILATLGALTAGSFMAWTSPALPLLQDKVNHFVVTTEQGSWIGSLMNLGAFLGALPAGFAADRFGRKTILVALALPLIASWLLIAFSSAVWELYLGRLLGGMAVGAISVSAPMYIAELAESSVRGTLGSLFQLQITLGILFGYLVGLVGQTLPLALICCTVPVVYLFTFVWMPESPVFLLQKDRKEEATRSLKWFRGNSYDVDDELTRMKDAIEMAQENRGGVLSLLSSRGTVKALIISLGLMAFQQLSGVNAVIFYSGTIFKSAGSEMSPNIAAIVIGITQVLATYVSTLLVDRAGRRALLLVSDSVMAISLAALGGYFYLQDSGSDVSAVSWLPLLSIAVFIVVFSVGFGPIPWIMLGELFPSDVKASASAVAAAFNWMLAFIVTKVFQNLVLSLGVGVTFWLFSATCVVGTVFVAFLVPETKGKDLEEIQAELSGRRRQVDSDGTKKCCGRVGRCRTRGRPLTKPI